MNLEGLNATAEEIHKGNVERGFYDNPKEFGTLLMLTVSELAEALEAHRKGFFNFKQELIVERPKFEEWKGIPSEPKYQASSMGNIRSIDMIVNNGNGEYLKKGKVLSPGLGGNGYHTVSVGGGKSKKVSRLVCEAFYGPASDYVVNHINGDKTCNWVTNLEYTSHSGNLTHAIRTGLKQYDGKLSYFDKCKICFRIKSGERLVDIHKDYPNVTISAIKALKYRGIEKYTDSAEFEIADTMIRLLDMCGFMKLDIESHIKLKLEFNATRGKKHGKEY